MSQVKKEKKLKRAPDMFKCPVSGCAHQTIYQGTADDCNVYVCADDHLTRKRIGWWRKEFNGLNK